MTTNAGLGLTGLGASPVTTNFVWNGVIGLCGFSGYLVLTGVLHGWCDLAWGTGIAVGSYPDDHAHTFDFVTVEYRVLFTGEMAGVGHFIPDPTSSGSCTNWTAHRFLTSLEVVLVDDLPGRCNVHSAACGPDGDPLRVE